LLLVLLLLLPLLLLLLMLLTLRTASWAFTIFALPIIALAFSQRLGADTQTQQTNTC
jgi:hypothetical protein